VETGFREWLEASRTVQEGRSGSMLRRSMQYLTGLRASYSPAGLEPDAQSLYSKLVMTAMKAGENYDPKSLGNLAKALVDDRRRLKAKPKISERERLASAKQVMQSEYPMAPAWLAGAVERAVGQLHREPK